MAKVSSLRCMIPKFATNLSSFYSVTVPNVLRRCQVNHFVNKRRFCASLPKQKKETVTIYFVSQDGTKLAAKSPLGDNLLDIIVDNDLDIDGFGACEGTLACSTCHLIFKKADYDKIPDKPTDEELDMLDLAYGLSDTSRLGCQVIVTKDMDGMEVIVPSGVADARNPS